MNLTQALETVKIAEVLRTLHSEVAQGLHMIEADLPKDFKN